MTRRRRIEARSVAQTSPAPIAYEALRLVRGDAVADVGCGTGAYGFLLRAGWSWTESWTQQGIPGPRTVVGVDASWHATELARRHHVYDELAVADCTRLPLADGAVDTALCVETVEHLFPAEVPRALAELGRIARERVVLTTPAPDRAFEHEYLAGELADARGDPEPLPFEELVELARGLHKAWLEPAAMERAGFQRVHGTVAGSIVYWTEPARIELDRLGAVDGVAATLPRDDGRADWRAPYAELVEAVLAAARTAGG
jgi:SAM-dependent methyltransferase